MKKHFLLCLLASTVALAYGQGRKEPPEMYPRFFSAHLTNAVLEHIMYTDTAVLFSEEEKESIRQGKYPDIRPRERLFDKPVFDYSIPFDFTPDPYAPDYYLLDVKDWILVNKKDDTIRLCLPPGFNEKEKRYLGYLSSKSFSPTLLLSGQATLNDFEWLQRLSPLERLQKRLVRFGVNNTVYPKDAYYAGISQTAPDSAFWDWMTQRHCGGIPAFPCQFYIMENQIGSRAIVLAEEGDKDFDKLKIIYFRMKEEIITHPYTPPPPVNGMPPPPPKREIVFHNEEVVTKVNRKPRSPEDVETTYSRVSHERLESGGNRSFLINFNQFIRWR